MPKNKVIYWGVLVAAGASLLWVGAVFLSKIKDILPYFVFFGVAMIVAGVVLELRKSKLKEASGTMPTDEPPPV